MAAIHGAHKRDPINDEWWFFAEPNVNNKLLAQCYHDLALKHFISFRGIFKMVVAVLQDLRDELEVMGAEGEIDAQLLKFKLPAKEALAIWCRAREGLLRLAELYPEKREKIEAMVAEQQDVLLAMLERYERKGSD